MTDIPVPDALRRAHRAWTRPEGPRDEPTRWNREAWEPSVGTLPVDLDDRPLSRAYVAAWFQNVTTDDRPAQREAFLVAMIWGYGRGGLGPWRVARIMRQSGFDEDLAHLTRVVMDHGGPAAVEFVGQQRRSLAQGRTFLKYLGPAFGTKYIYFLTKAHGVHGVAPILDSVVREWFHRNVDGINVQIGDGWEKPHRYADYVRVMEEWGQALGLAPDDVELLIFEYGATDSLNLDADELLARLTGWFHSRGAGDEADPHLRALEELAYQGDAED